MNRLFVPRIAFTAIFLICVALIGYAMYLQFVENLEPCPMCILQRYAFIAIALVALVAAIHDPRSLALTIYSGLVVVFAIAGGGVAVRHSWLQHFPPLQQNCGADLGYLFESLPLSRALPAIFRGSGSCTDVQWKFVGLSIPEWALVWFVVFVIAAMLVVAKAPREK